ncbi:glycosyl hydrolase family 3 N terminal domain-containing [Fusarium albosuccineum]|uniref:Beta-glucosidase cel3A n=1 Tax=Fusarium albosuccineum TaxID=1237068 RepID=A0A8H4LIZ0_9HYPO|nr:glycosyl hydrolase family 3 N terminal domain-containing [Fusarium albosuccineum]
MIGPFTTKSTWALLAEQDNIAVTASMLRKAFGQRTTGTEWAMHQWDEAEQKATQFVASLNLTEKVTLVTGSLTEGSAVGCIGRVRPIERVGFPGLCLMDGPNAVNRAHLVSIFPSGMTAAASWDRDMLYQRGVALGREFKAKGGHVILGPTTGPIGRHPAGGRNWEGFSPDPYLSGEAIKYTVMGHQSAGVQTSSKHFIGNEQETQRSNTVHEDGSVTEGISSNIDDRTLHELYLWPFADAIKAGTTSIMCSYNRLNQTYACEHPHLLKNILRKELGFRGYVVSDWFATHSTSEAANAGLDMEQPGEVPAGAPGGYGGDVYFGSKLEKAVQAGNVTQERINAMVRNLMTPYFLLHQDTSDYPPVDPSLRFLLSITNIGWDSPYIDARGPPQPGFDVRGNHHELIRKMGASATVLLKNENDTLPLNFNGKEGIRNIGVFGNAAIDPTEGIVVLPSEDDVGPEYGPLTIGGGAGSGRNSYLISPLEAIRTRARKSGAMVQHLASNDVIASNDFRSIYPKPDICVVFLKSYAEETFDRPSLELSWNSTLVVKNVAKFCGAGKTVVVTNSAGVNVLPWVENANVTAILATHYPGQEIGNSIADVLWGDTEPSGRLPYTIPKTEEDYGFPIVNLTGSDGKPEKDSSKWQANFTEGTLIDYRHFDFNDIDPQFEFGFGLGYTTFEPSSEAKIVQLVTGTVSELPNPKSKVEPGGNTELWTDLFPVSVRVKNTGARKGSTTVQLYLSLPEVEGGQDVPVRVLRGFEKVELRKHETRQVEFKLRRRDLSYWDVTKQQWRIPRGEFKLSIGFSSRNLPVTQELRIS